jgi:hypothetical protein
VAARPRLTQPARLGLAVAGTVLLLAGCTTGSTPGQGTATTSAAAPPIPTTAPPISAPHTIVSTPVVPPPSTDGRQPSSAVATPSGNTCTGLTVRVLQGGATPGREIAAVTFDNDSRKACSLSGYPTVVLTLKGNTIATATPAPGTVAEPVRLAPGGQAQSLITDRSTCNAPLSDTIAVTAPNGAAGGKLTRPFQLRGCTVYVDPVKPSS